MPRVAHTHVGDRPLNRLSSVASEVLEIPSASCIYRAVAVTPVCRGLVEQLHSVRGPGSAADCQFAAALSVLALPFVAADPSLGLGFAALTAAAAAAEELLPALPSELAVAVLTAVAEELLRGLLSELVVAVLTAVAEELLRGLLSELVVAVLTAAGVEPSPEFHSVPLAPAVGDALAGDTLKLL